MHHNVLDIYTCKMFHVVVIEATHSTHIKIIFLIKDIPRVCSIIKSVKIERNKFIEIFP